jgi:hypothetical protein
VGNRPAFKDLPAASTPAAIWQMALHRGRGSSFREKYRLQVHAGLSQQSYIAPAKAVKSCFAIPGLKKLPVPLTTDFFGRQLDSPLSCPPHPHDGYEQMKKASEAGWAGGI